MTAVPRIAPIPPREWDAAMPAALAPLTPKTPRPRGYPRGFNILGTFAHHPDLAASFLAFNGHLLNSSSLTPRQVELAILRVACVRRSPYEWHQHVVAARDAGITPDEIVAVGDRGAGYPWPTEDDALLTAVDELIDLGTVTDDTWTTLAASLDTPQVLDLIYTVGAYIAIAMMLAVAGTPLDEDLRAAATTEFPTR